MNNSNSFRVGYELQADRQGRAPKMAVAPQAVAAEETPNIPKMAYDAECIAAELVRQYLQCSTSVSRIFNF